MLKQNVSWLTDSKKSRWLIIWMVGKALTIAVHAGKAVTAPEFNHFDKEQQTKIPQFEKNHKKLLYF